MKPSRIRRIAATFIVRLWREAGPHDAGDWRGQVEHVQSGDKWYFHDMVKVLDFIAGHLGGGEEKSRRLRENDEQINTSAELNARHDPPGRG